jgi:dihydroorotate dehydrogenase
LGEALKHLLGGLKSERMRLTDEFSRYVPLAVKISPDLEANELAPLAELLIRHGIDGVIATNTTLSREGVELSALANESGGLSGKPLFEKSTAVVAKLAETLQGAIPIIACGGILSAEDANAKFQAGASLVQIYSGFIYRGPALIADIVRSLQ